VSLFNLSFTFYGIFEESGVSKRPGAIATTLMPNLPKSLAIGITMPLIAPFVAEYATCPL
jgi:hypothetical protein